MDASASVARTEPARRPKSRRRQPFREGRRATASYRVGIGYDSHRLVDGGPLRLGGCEVPFDRSLAGHSDADALLHAITDALLGAAARGDIGEMFPNTDPANRGRDSREMLRLASDCVADAGYRIVNLDCVVYAERPKLTPHKVRIRQHIADILRISPDQVGLKGKTGEGVGTVGRGEVIAAQCVALLERVMPEHSQES